MCAQEAKHNQIIDLLDIQYTPEGNCQDHWHK